MLKIITLFFISLCWSQEKTAYKQSILLSVLKQYTLYSISYEKLFNDDYSYDIGVFPIRIDENIIPVTTLAIKRHFTENKRYHVGLGSTFYENRTIFQLLLGLKSSSFLNFKMQFEIAIGLNSDMSYTFFKSEGDLRFLPSFGIGYSF